MESKQRRNNDYYTDVTEHQYWNDNANTFKKVRDTNTFKSSVPMGVTGANVEKRSLIEKYKNEVDSKSKRDRQFANTPFQPGATRQSYQDSDIFGTKGGRETVQNNIDQKSVKQRDINTFSKSNVLLNQEDHEVRDKDFTNMGMGGDFGKHHISRQERKWESNVFAGPKPEEVRRKILGKNDHGKGNLWGDEEREEDYKYRKTNNFAGEISTKEPTRDPYFDEKEAEERKLNELYGNSKYAVNKKATWKEKRGPLDNEADRQTRKMNEFQSNILTH